MTKNYIVDHLSVLMVKTDFGQEVQEELKQFAKEYKTFANSETDSLLGGLYEINRLMYPIHDVIMKSGVEDKQFRFETELLLKLNARRVYLRSEIAKLFNEHTEYKTYA